jgi:hypothetical protein
MWRVSTMVVQAGLAPAALVGKKTGNEAASAVAIAVMAGAELGLPPMVALRSFTVIGGRPALYGDGIINVARRSKKAAYIRTGYDEAGKFGWCEAKRSDTGEEKRVEFSEADARAAGLWDDRQTVKRKGYDGNWKDAPNDAPWHRYPKRMLAWRAAGYCLRELFADVLGGIADEFEAREIAGHDEPVNITPPAAIRPPSPAAKIAPPVEDAEVVEEVSGEPIDYGDYFERLQEAMNDATDEASIEEVWSDFDPDATFQDDADSFELAAIIKRRQLAKIHPLNAM